MLFSEARKFVFVAVPKTGTTAVQNRLLKIDPDLHRNAVHNAAGNLVPVPTHATAAEIRQIMGARAKGVRFVAFLRDPHDVVVSKYHFYRSGRAARKQGLAATKDGETKQFSVGRTARVLFAKALPLTLWAKVYPFSASASFITDADGALIVDDLGRMEQLQQDVLRIFTGFGYSPEDLHLSVANHTEYTRARDPRVEAVVARRLPRDQALFDQIGDGA